MCSEHSVFQDRERASQGTGRIISKAENGTRTPDWPISRWTAQWRKAVIVGMPNMEPIEILLVEDNPGDARLAFEALKESKIHNNLNHVVDGVEAMRFLRREGEYADAAQPDLILLDLNMPRKDGREVLAEVKADPEFKLIPVVVLTTSAAERDLVKSYDLHANAYVVKPIDLNQFIDVVQAIEIFWFSIVKLPPARDD
jgi:two-component system, chemotaxis family, response regulator Rcp1